MKKRFEVRILGQELSVISDSGDEHVAGVIKFVNGKVEEAGKIAGNRSPLDVAILAALNIADEYLHLMGEKDRGYNRLESRAEQLIHLINDVR